MSEDNSAIARVAAVEPAHRFDEAALAAFLRAHVESFAGTLTVEQFQGGASNPTFLLTAGAEGRSPVRYVLRKRPPGQLLASAHQVDREFRIMKALWETPVPVPRMRVLCEDESVIGTSFYVMDYVDGEILGDPALPDRTAAVRATMHGSFLETMVALHAVDYGAVGLGDLNRPGDFIERQLSRFTKQYRAAEDMPIPEMEELIARLPQALPPDRRVAIVHGDYKFGNVMFDRATHKVGAVLDWELTTIGDPLADLAFSALGWYGGIGGRGSLAASGLPEGVPAIDDYVGRYCRLTGRAAVEGWNFYLAFSLFRLASIMQGVYRRVLSGSVASHFEPVNMAPELARQALHLLDSAPRRMAA